MVFALSMIANLLMLTPTIYMLQIYDRILISQSELSLLFVSLICLGLLSSMVVSEWVRSKILLIINDEVVNKYSELIFEYTFSQKLKINVKEAVQPFADLNSVKNLISGQSINALLDAPWTPVYVLVMFLMHPILGWMSLIFLISMSFIAWLTASKTNQYKDQTIEEEKESNSFIYSKLRNAEVIEALGMTENLRDKWWTKQKLVLQSISRADTIENILTTFSKETAILKQSLALGVGAYLVIKGELSVGSMIAANLLMGRTTAPVDMLISSWKNFQQGLQALERIEKIINEDKSITKKISINDSLNAEIRIDNLYTKFPESEGYTLNDISLSIPSGQKIALVGESGSGKSTLIKCLLGLINYQQGEIKFNGILVQEINYKMIGNQIGYLSQNVALFDGTIAENITRFENIDSAKVIEASKFVGIHEFILRLPDGYNTRITGKSGSLSAGQKQRLVLARAMYNNPKLLILDEPDSNLDEIGENALELAMKNTSVNKLTVIVVTHKEKLLQHVDRIITLDKGRVIKDEIVRIEK